VTYYYFTMTGQIRRRIEMRYTLRTLHKRLSLQMLMLTGDGSHFVVVMAKPLAV
jgi:hypothetical protein